MRIEEASEQDIACLNAVCIGESGSRLQGNISLMATENKARSA